MTEVEITGRFDEGYLRAEYLYCKKEEEEFYACKEHYKSPTKAQLRFALRRKRAEFNKKWLRGKIK